MKLPHCTHPLVATLVLATLGACGGGGSTGTPSTGGGTGTEKSVPLEPVDAVSLTAHFRDRLSASATATSAGPRWGFAVSTASVAPTPSATAAPTPTANSAAASPATDTNTGASATVLQETGVDEGDVIVSDGATVYAIAPRRADGPHVLTVRSVAGGGTALTADPSVTLPGGYTYDALYLPAGLRRLVATGTADTPIAVPQPAPGSPAIASMLVPIRSPLRSSVRILDLADPARPGGGTTLTLDGQIQASRMVDGRLWLVLRSEPRLDGFDWSWAPSSQAANRAYIASLTASALLPTLRRDDGAAEPLVAEQDCFVQPASPGGIPSIVTIVSIDLTSSALTRRARCFAGGTETVYMTRDSLYLASLRYPYALVDDVRVFGSTGVVTDLHKFALGADAITYRGSGRVPGRLNWGADTARYMLSESGRDLRVVTSNEGFGVAVPTVTIATFTTSTGSTGGSSGTGAATPGTQVDPAAASPARLTVLRDTGSGLTAIATLPNAARPAPIGKAGEQVYAVRYVGARAYVVTFRRTDPLYVIDLADATDPKLAGQLEVPGFSDRLYPLTDTLLLGVGHDAVDGTATGVRVSLLDVTAPDRPVERASRTIGGQGSSSASDRSPHGTMIRRVGDRIRVALPVERHGDASSAGSAASNWPSFSALEAWRFVIDPATGAWTEPAPVAATDAVVVDGGSSGRWRDARDSWLTRSLDLGDTSWLYYDGRFASAPW